MATDRLPAGLSISAFVAILSLGIAMLWGGLRQPEVYGPEKLVHTMAGLCLLWSAAAYLVSLCLPGLMQRPIGKDVAAVLQIASMVTGLVAVIVMLYVACLEMLCRTVFLEYQFPWRVNLWRTGMADIIALAGSLVLHWVRTRSQQLVTVLFWLMVFAAVWFSCRVASHRELGWVGGVRYAVPSHWASVLMFLLAVLVLVWTLAEGWRRRHRRLTAWPDALWLLVTPPASWPGFHYSAGIVAAIVLILDCIHVVLPLTILSGFLAGGSVLALAHREWNENLADAGLALLTLAVVSLCMSGLDMPIWSSRGYAEILNRVLIGLAMMVWFWHWLAGMWRQQLDQGQAWTTAGRMIRAVRRVGFLVSTTAILVSLHLSFLPRLLIVTDLDNTTNRWLMGLAGNGLLILALLSSIRDTNRRTLAWLILFTAGSTVAFALIRAPGSLFAQLWTVYWPLAMTGVAAACLLTVTFLSSSSPWRALIEPLVFTGVLIAPLSAIAGVSMAEHLSMPPWLPAATYGCLTAVYLLAAIVPGPVTFTVVAVVCGLIAVWYLRRFVGSHILPLAYFYGLLCGLSLALTALVYRHQVRPGTARLLKWLGGSLVLISLVAMFIASQI